MENPLKYNISTRFRLRLIAESISPKKDDAMLDVGCGVGLMSWFFSRKCKVYGIDVSYDSVKFASRNKRTQFVTGDALALPFKDNSFDYIITSEVMEHVEDGSSFVRELKRVTKPSGIIILSTPSLDGLLRVSKVCHSHGSEYHHRAGYSKKELVPMFRKNGLKVLKVRYGLNFFTQIFMEAAKLCYNLKNPKFEDQAEIQKEKNSFLFRVYKKIFIVAPLLITIDAKLEKLIKGSNIMIIARKQ